MARVLIVGGGRRGRALSAALGRDGHAVRVVTRRTEALPEIAAVGAEGVIGDPDRIGTLMDAVAGVTVVCWLLGSAHGAPEQVAELHSGRLRMLLSKLVDTPVRGFVYEAAGTLPAGHHDRGRALVRAAASTWELPVEILEVDPADQAAWEEAARCAVERLLTPGVLRR